MQFKTQIIAVKHEDYAFIHDLEIKRLKTMILKK